LGERWQRGHVAVGIEQLPAHYSEEEVAEYFCVSVDTLRRERKRGEIKCFRVGTKPRYTDKHILDYLNSKEICEKTDTPLATAGSRSAATAPYGAQLGSIPQIDKHTAHHLAQATFRKRS